jgi:hypothetical protein
MSILLLLPSGLFAASGGEKKREKEVFRGHPEPRQGAKPPEPPKSALNEGCLLCMCGPLFIMLLYNMIHINYRKAERRYMPYCFVNQNAYFLTLSQRR